MNKFCFKTFKVIAVFLLVFSVTCYEFVSAETGGVSKSDAGWMIDTIPYSISPPNGDIPLKIKIELKLLDINFISDHEQLVGFKAEIKLTWTDERNAFDPSVAGVDEKTYTGSFQFDELSTSWYPQVVLMNENSLVESGASIVKIKPDGSTSLLREINSSVRTPLDLRPFPFDSQKLLLKFALFGYATDEMFLEAENSAGNIVKPELKMQDLTVPEWSLISLRSAVGEIQAPLLGKEKNTSTFTLEIGVKREPVFVFRTVIVPLILVVLLCFSVFWLDVKSIQDRLNVSFIGILTITAYQLVIGDMLPHVAYFTFVHGLLNISLVMISLTVTVNIVMSRFIVGLSRANYLNQACKWVFPASYIFFVGLLYVTEIHLN